MTRVLWSQAFVAGFSAVVLLRQARKSGPILRPIILQESRRDWGFCEAFLAGVWLVVMCCKNYDEVH